MMTERIAEEVSRKVYEKLPELLLNVLVKQHAKHGFKSNCRCDYCKKKFYYFNLNWSLKNSHKHILEELEVLKNADFMP